jgi:Gram-negative bacterial TonB protein C-terminal
LEGFTVINGPRGTAASSFAAILLAVSSQPACSGSKPHEAVAEEPGAIVATVHGPSTPLHDVDVLLQGPWGTTLSGRTDSCGAVYFEGLPDGLYSLRAAQGGLDGYVENVAVIRGKDSMIDIRMTAQDPAALKQETGCTLGKRRLGPFPGYTPEALEKRVEGCMVIKCLITSQGRVRDCQALEPLAGLTAAAIDRLQRQIYESPICDGKPADMDYTFRISFRMPRS